VRRRGLNESGRQRPHHDQQMPLPKGFEGRGLLARFLYAMPRSLVGYCNLTALLA
jgi:hypothetical protein